jgi:hypothetical protein
MQDLDPELNVPREEQSENYNTLNIDIGHND